VGFTLPSGGGYHTFAIHHPWPVTGLTVGAPGTW